MGDVRQEIRLGRRPLGDVRSQLVELRLELHRANHGASDLGPERRRDHRREDDAAAERGPDRPEDDLGTFFPQDIPGGARGEGLRDALRIAGRRPSDAAYTCDSVRNRAGTSGSSCCSMPRAAGVTCSVSASLNSASVIAGRGR